MPLHHRPSRPASPPARFLVLVLCCLAGALSAGPRDVAPDAPTTATPTATAAAEEQAAAGALDAEDASRPAMRGVWVSRFHWRTPADIAAIFDRCADLGVDTVFWQVRGGGSVLYRSAIEQVDRRIAAGLRDGEPDPLELAVAEGRRRQIAVHAWMNLLPGWSGTEPPSDPAHPWNTRREWFMAERSPAAARAPGGVAEPRLGEGYAFLNPAVPEVRAYLASIAREIVTGYGVSGLVLDYVRYPGPTWSHDAASLARFGGDPLADAAGWNAFRVAQVDATVEAIAAIVRAERPDVLLSAAVWGDAQVGRERFFQAPGSWLARGWLDFTQPMIYVSDPAVFADLAAWHAHDTRRRHTVPAIGIYLFGGSPGTLREQVAALDALPVAGWSLYEYGTLANPELGGMAEAAREVLAAARPSVRWIWLARRIAGGDATPGPYITETTSDSPLLKEGMPFRIGARARHPRGVSLGEDPAARPYVEVGPTASLEGAQRVDLVALGDLGTTMTTALFVTHDAINAPAARSDVYLRAVAFARGEDGSAVLDGITRRGVGELKHYRPVLTRRPYLFRGFFAPDVPGAQYPVLAPGNRLWVVSELEGTVHVYEKSGAHAPFSPIRRALDPDGQPFDLVSPTAVRLDPSTGDLLVGERRAGALMLLRFGADGTPSPATRLAVDGSDFALDAIGQVYVPEAARRRWHVFAQDGTRLGGPYAPFVADDPRADSPSLQQGIAVTRDGRRVFVACGTSRVVDVYDLANAPAAVPTGGGPVELAEPVFAWSPTPLCRIGQGGAAIDLADDGRIFVSDPDDRVQVFDATGQLHLLDLWSDRPPLRRPRGVAMFPGGHAFFVAMHGGRDFDGQVQLWREKSPDDPPIPDDY